MAKKLQYFNLNGLAEAIRYILHYNGETFEDERYDRAQWPIKEIKDSLPFGQLPLYEENGRSIHQSLAIARYVAHRANLVPTDPWDQAVVDAAAYSVYDFMNKIKDLVKAETPEDKLLIRKRILEEDIDFYFSRFEKDLKANNGHFGGKLSWADFILIAILETVNMYLDITIEANYPTVKALVEKIRGLKGVKEYIAMRQPYTF